MYAVIRVRGTVGIKENIKDTLKLLNLNKPNHCTILEQKKENEGMLQKARNYITWGELNKEGIKHLIQRADFENKELDEILEEKNKNSIDELANEIIEKKIKPTELDIKKTIRLHPPRKGYNSTKRSYKEGGSLGYRGEDINKLIYRMR